MAKMHSNRKSAANNRTPSGAESRPNILASCYIVDAASMNVTGLHYSAGAAGT
jgi:hypothetical protein